MPEGNESTENPKVADADLTPIPDVTQNDQAQVHTYYERVYADPGESIFWYGFGQGILQFFSGINSSLGAYLSDWFCDLWDFVTGQYELVLHSEATVQESYAGSDVDTLRSAGLSEQEIAQITGGTLDESGKVAVKTVSTDASGDKQISGTSPQAAQKSSADETIVIPENPSEDQRVDYELTYYVNNVNAENIQVLMEYGKRDELKNVYTYGNERISVDTIADTYNAVDDDFQTDYYLYDGRGSVVNVVSTEAEILTSYTYDPFGNVTSGAPEFDSFYGYNGEETNPVTGLQYLRARYYDTDTGRFNVADTYLGDISQPLTLNRYSYTVNNPVMRIDPSGHWPGWLDKVVDGAKKVAKSVLEFAEKHADVIGATIGAVGGAVLGATVVAITAPISVPALAVAAGVATGVGVAAVGTGVGGSIKTNYEVKQYNKKQASLLQEYDSIDAEIEELQNNISSYTPKQAQQKLTYIQQRMQAVEERRQQLCETGEKLQKQAVIYGNITSAGFGLAAAGLAPISGPALVTSMAGNTLLAGVPILGSMTVGTIASIGVAGAGAVGVTYAGSNIVETVTDFNPIKDTLYGGNAELFEEHQQAIDAINTTTVMVGAMTTVDALGQMQAQAQKPSTNPNNVNAQTSNTKEESGRGYNPQPGERTLDGYVRNNADPEISLTTQSPGFNNNNGDVGGVFKRFGAESHGGVSPHVHQPQRNVAPNGSIYGSVGTKTYNGGVTFPSPKDVKQLYEYLNNGKYQ